jgi:hypothetical protein
MAAVKSLCDCDLDSPCDIPECIAEREATAAYYAGVFATPTLKLNREEWADVYADNAGKALAYPKEW